MIKSDGMVRIDTLVDTKGFGKGINTMEKQMGGLSKTIGKLGLAIGAAFAVGKLVQFGKEAIDLGSDLQEVQNVVDVTFTTMSDKVNEFAQGAAEAAGLSETMAKKYVGTFGAMAKAFGFAEGETFDMSTALTQLAGDVASFYNLTQDEAYTKLKSVFTGETETLKDLGVVMTQNALDSYAMAEGYGKTTKQMSEQEKVALRYAFVLDQLSSASGDFERTSGSWANQIRILQLNFDSFKANIGQALINIFTPLLKVINQIVAKMAQLSQHFVAFSELLVGKSTSGGGGSPGDALEEIESGYENVAEATDEATKAQNKYLTGLDEIHTFANNGGVDDIGSGANGLDGLSSAASDEFNKTAGLIEELEGKYPELIEFAQDSMQKLKEIFADFSVGDFFEAGKDTSDLITGIFNFISEAIGDVNWKGIGNKIGDFIAGIDWLEIIKSAIKLTINIWEAIAGVWFGVFEAAPIETAIVTAIGALKFTGLKNVLAQKISEKMPDNIHVGKTLALTFAAVQISFNVGKSLSKSLIEWSNEKYGTDFGTEFIDSLGLSDILFDVGPEVFMHWLKNPSFTLDTWSQMLFGHASFSELLDNLFDDGGSAKKIVEGFLGLWSDADLSVWWANNVVPWFKEKKWQELFGNIKKALSEKWKEIKDWWENNAISKWFKENVSPWLSKEEWEEAMSGIKEAFDSTWNGAVNVAISLINKFIDYLNENMHFEWDAFKDPLFGKELWGAGSIQLFTVPKIPYLATGAVIPPNAPFMAVLGDQKRGTNIEAPLDTIKQAVREVVGNGNGGGQYAFTAQINRRTLFEEMIDEAKLRQSTSGRNPFDLA